MERLHSRKLLLQLCLLLPLYFSSILLLSSAYTVPDKYFINCGASDNISSADGQRVFVGDRDFSGGKGKAVKSSNSSTDTLYQTARVYEKTSSYEFKITENGTYIVRLHFFVFSSSPDLSVALFNVWASGFSLLTNYSIRNITTSPRIEEFLLTIPQGDFQIYFIPSQNSSLAFVNAIEVFLAPDKFIVDNATRITSTGDNVAYSGLISQVLHTIHRINVGGDYINGDDLWRNWVPDDKYLVESASTMNTSYGSTPNYQTGGVTKYIAPDLVYRTARQLKDNSNVSNATWSFPVNKNATHFVRVHFCDIISTTPADLWFNLYINYNVPMIDPYNITLQLATPFFFDFVVDPDNSGYVDFSILNKGLLVDSTIRNAFLNGLEIMEFMEKSNYTPKESESKKKLSPVIIGLVSSGAFVILVMVVAKGLKCRKQEPDQSLELLYGRFNSNNRLNETSNAFLAPNLNFSLRISLAEIRRATDNFNAKLLIGKGGFGKVYKGTLRNGMTVAVKRGEAGHGQGLHEFQNEIIVLSQIRYHHLVSLIGYCDQGSEMILVYEFMKNGTLRDHLYHTDGCSEKSSLLFELSWKQRLEVCIGAASGLDYLHTQAGRIIHRDVKSTNILLDKAYVAKVADFGLSKSGPPDPINCTTGVKGSYGYFDPKYLATQQLTEKSNVDSFGVVLFEVLCARPPVDNSLPEEEVSLTEWAMQMHKKGQLEKIIDPVLVGKIKAGSLRKFSETAEKCLKLTSTERPSMRQVLYDLKLAQQLQEPVKQIDQHEVSTTNITSLIGLQLPGVLNFPVQEDDEAPIGGDDESDKAATEVFIQLRIDGAS